MNICSWQICVFHFFLSNLLLAAWFAHVTHWCEKCILLHIDPFFSVYIPARVDLLLLLLVLAWYTRTHTYYYGASSPLQRIATMYYVMFNLCDSLTIRSTLRLLTDHWFLLFLHRLERMKTRRNCCRCHIYAFYVSNYAGKHIIIFIKPKKKLAKHSNVNKCTYACNS